MPYDIHLADIGQARSVRPSEPGRDRDCTFFPGAFRKGIAAPSFLRQLEYQFIVVFHFSYPINNYQILHFVQDDRSFILFRSFTSPPAPFRMTKSVLDDKRRLNDKSVQNDVTAIWRWN